MLKRKDRHARIHFTDIAARGFDATAYGTTQAALMARIRGRLADGSWIEGVEVFRRLYAAIGWHRIVAVSRLPLISHLLRAGYVLFARNRLRLTGRCAPDGSCALPAGNSCSVERVSAACATSPRSEVADASTRSKILPRKRLGSWFRSAP